MLCASVSCFMTRPAQSGQPNCTAILLSWEERIVFIRLVGSKLTSIRPV